MKKVLDAIVACFAALGIAILVTGIILFEGVERNSIEPIVVAIIVIAASLTYFSCCGESSEQSTVQDSGWCIGKGNPSSEVIKTEYRLSDKKPISVTHVLWLFIKSVFGIIGMFLLLSGSIVVGIVGIALVCILFGVVISHPVVAIIFLLLLCCCG
jgi:hypothetical protein